MALRREVFEAINDERVYMAGKWGNPHTVGEWILIMREELDEAQQAWVKKSGDKDALLEILQVASVAVACMEQHGIVERHGLWDSIAAQEKGGG